MLNYQVLSILKIKMRIVRLEFPGQLKILDLPKIAIERLNLIRARL